MTHDAEHNQHAIRVLILEEDMVRLRLLEMTLRSRGHLVTLCTDAEAAWREYSRAPHSLVLLAGSHPGALLFCRRAREQADSYASAIIIIAWPDRPTSSRFARLAGADEILLMPLDPALANMRLVSIERKVGLLARREKVEDELWKTRAALEKRLAEQAACLASTERALREERAARGNAQADLDRVRADVERGISEHATHAGAMAEALGVEKTRRAKAEVALRDSEQRVQRLVAYQSDQVRALRVALAAEADRRRTVEAALRRAEDEGERRAADHANAVRTVTEALRLETSYRTSEEATLRSARNDAEKRIADQAADIERLRDALDAETRRRVGLEAALGGAQENTAASARGRPTPPSSLQPSPHLRPLLDRESFDVAWITRADSRFPGNQLRKKSGREFWEVILSRTLGIMERDAELSLLTAQHEREVAARHHSDLRIQGASAPGQAVNAQEIALLSRKLGEEAARREQAEALQRTAEATNRTNAETLASGRRDLRIMMDGVLGATELALDADLTPAQQDHLQALRSAATAALGALDNRLGPGNVTPLRRQPQPVGFGLRSLLAAPFAALENRARRKGVRLMCAVAPGVPDRLAGSPRQLRHAIAKLVGHAITVTASGEVTVCVDCAGRERNRTALLVTIADGTSGLTVERQLAMFEAVARSREIISQPAPETELDLPIAAELIRSMGGRLWFESDVDQGTTMRFTTSLELGSDVETRMAGPGILRSPEGEMPIDSVPGDSQGRTEGRLVLLADDTPDDRAAAARLLERQGHHVITVSDGRQAIAAAEEHPFDIALIDLRMPRMDGFEVAAVIRTLEDPRGPRLPIVALASFAGKVDQERCLAVGIDCRVTKPLEPTAVSSTIRKLLSRAA